MEERIILPSSTTAAAVSSHDDSIPRIIMILFIHKYPQKKSGGLTYQPSDRL
jgi:hypothetical protein